jgi:type I restriction enzyme, S subunit
MTTVVPLAELVLPDAPICYGILKRGDHVSEGVPQIEVRDYRHGMIDTSDLVRAHPDIDKQFERSRLKPGDVLLSIRGTTGLVALVPPELDGANISRDSARIRIVPPDNRFVYHVLQSSTVQREIRDKTIGQAVQGINLAAVRGLSIPWLPKQIRRLVTRMLDDCDAARRLLDESIDAKRIFKRGLMQQLLTGQKRFPRFTDRSWAEVRLGSIFNERSEVNRPDLPLLSVTNDRGVIPRDELVKRDTSNPDKSKYKRVAVGDIAYNTMRMWQGVSAISSLEGIVSPAYTVAIPTNRIYGPYAKHLFKFPPVINLFHRHSQGLVDDTLNLKFDRFAKIKVTIPIDTLEQERIAGVLDVCEAEINMLETLREHYERYKRALLARLLNGDLAGSYP